MKTPIPSASISRPVTNRQACFRLGGLDGLRAVGALAVLAYHLFPAQVPGGFLGVDVFFVLSGFLITSLLVKDYQDHGRVRLQRFWLRRFRRLFPAVAFTVFVMVPVAALASIDLLVSIRRQVVGSLTFTYNWLDIWAGQSYFDRGNPPLLRNMWSLAVEQQFYLLWPLILGAIFWFSPRLRPAVALALALASALAMAWLFYHGANLTRIYQGADTHSFGLMLGAAMALAIPNCLEPRPKVPSIALVWWRGVGAWVAFAGIIVAFLVVNDQSAWTYPGAISAVSILTLLVIYSLIDQGTHRMGPGGVLYGFLELRFMRWLGDRSYSLYLWHWPIIVVWRTAWPNSGVWVQALAIPALSLLAAAISFRWIETPMRQNGIMHTIESFANGMQRQPTAGRSSKWIMVVALVTSCVTGLAVAIGVQPEKTAAQRAVEQGMVYLRDNAKRATSPSVKTPTTKPPPTQNKPEKAQVREGKTPTVDPGQVTVIGDSVTLASAQRIEEELPGIYIDAAVSRFPHQGPGILRTLLRDGRLRPYVVFALGTNGNFTVAQGQEILDIIGIERKLVVLTSYAHSGATWIGESNQSAKDLAAQYPTQVKLMDWAGQIVKHQDYLAADSTHPSDSGARLYARAMKTTLNEFLAPQPPPGFSPY